MYESKKSDQSAVNRVPDTGAQTFHVLPPAPRAASASDRSCSLVVEQGDIRVTNPQIAEITEQAQQASRRRDVTSLYAPGTRIFTPCAPGFPDLGYIWTPVPEQRKEEAAPKPEYRSPRLDWTADKIVMREIAREIGIIEQPEFRALTLNVPRPTHRVLFSHIDFGQLPLEDLIAPDSCCPALVFEDRDRGFVVTFDAGKFFADTTHPLIREALVRHGVDGAGTSLEILRRSLQSLNESEYEVAHASCRNSAVYREAVKAELRTLPDGVWFIKDIDGSRGGQVIRCTLQNGEVIAADVGTRNREMMLEFSPDEISINRTIAHMFAPREMMSRPIIARPILERAIPIETADGILAEPRLVFQINSGAHYLCSYSKVSEVEAVVPNRFQGGGGEPVRDSFRRILQARGVDEHMLDDSVEETVQRMIALGSRFADEFTRAAGARGFLYGPIFAVDLAPVWNQSSGEISFVLIEVQPQPGTHGAAGNIPPEEQARVNEYNSSVDEFYPDEFQ